MLNLAEKNRTLKWSTNDDHLFGCSPELHQDCKASISTVKPSAGLLSLYQDCKMTCMALCPAGFYYEVDESYDESDEEEVKAHLKRVTQQPPLKLDASSEVHTHTRTRIHTHTHTHARARSQTHTHTQTLTQPSSSYSNWMQKTYMHAFSIIIVTAPGTS